jgi:uncharacterized protein YjbJ (UPF0337 family)
MNSDQLLGRWKQIRGGMRQRWGTITGDPVAFNHGTRDRLDGRNQEQRGLAHRDANRQLAAFMRRNRYWSDLSKH